MKKGFIAEYGLSHLPVKALKHRDAASLSLLENLEKWMSEISPGIRIHAELQPAMNVVSLNYAFQQGTDIKILRMHRLGIPQDRIAKRLGMDQKTIHNHLGKMAALPNFLNGDLRVTFRLSLGFTVAHVAQKHGWPDPMVWKFRPMSRPCWMPAIAVSTS